MEFTPSAPDHSSLYQQAACGLACTTDDGILIAVNDTLCQWIGRSANDLVGKVKLQDLLTMGGRIFHQTHWAPLLRMQGSISEVKLELVHSSGARIPMVMNAIRREASVGFLHEIAMFVARDRDAYERELIASRAKLEALVEERTKLHLEAEDRALFAEQMMGIVSHDLRNPLSAIKMGMSLLTRPNVDKDMVLGRVNRASERAIRMVADLLDFTQARLGKGIAVSRSSIDLDGCVADAVEELALANPERKISHRHFGSSFCYSDADRLSQLVGNLVSNAVAYGLKASPIEVLSEVQGGEASISVRNWGDPIPEAIQERLFQPMVRGTVEATSRSVGLGLYIVSEIAKAHDGSVEVTSSLEDGTAFIVRLHAPPTE